MRLPYWIGSPDGAAMGSAVGTTFQQALGTCGIVALVGSSLLAPAPLYAATNGAAIGSCLIQKAPLPLARCVLDPICAANLLCIQTCTNRADEATCQIKCGDEFAGPVVEDFTKAAVSDTKCVPQRSNDGSWPVPKSSALVKKLSATDLEGEWYISAGLNTAFDIFDCQFHRFEAPSPTKLVGNLQWRIKDPIAGTNFVTRYTVQEFDQDLEQPGILYNHDNEFLHYQDDWYVLAFKANEYFVVYYCGTNDAWDGYGGAVVYTRAPSLPKKYIPEITEALARIDIKFSDFQLTDNSCRASETRLEELEADLRLVSTKVAGGIQLAGREIVKEVEVLESEAVDEVKLVGRAAKAEAKAVGDEVIKDFKAVEKTVEQDVVAVEREVERDLSGLRRFFLR
mmetsp:Transcript_76069/g.126793  ORF Transcript_76069/g.126793 Transcript_76069/m.126793 type:complete len:397 (-) Transcript_76069:328-1518(-)